MFESAEDILALTDDVLATLYSDWSEAHYCAGWLAGGEAEFVASILEGPCSCAEPVSFTDYQKETLAEIRRLLREISNV